MVKKIIALSLAVSVAFVLSAAPSGAATHKKATTASATSQIVSIAGPPTCCSSPGIK